MHLWLARHGETAWNQEGRFQGQCDLGLTELGERQGRALGRRLATERIDIVYTSDLQRAWHTAELATEGRNLPIIRDPAWRELRYGAWEGLTREEVAKRFPVVWRQRGRAGATGAPHGGESLVQLQNRIVTALTCLRQRHHGEAVLIVTHGGPLTVLACLLRGIDLEQRPRGRATNGGLSSVNWEAAEPSIDFWDEAVCVE